MSQNVLDDVSRETIEALKLYEKLVQKWTRKINLVSAKDAKEIWDRHIVDSIQVYQAAPVDGDWLDIGSGGGFPGIVAAILARDLTPDRKFTLIDSDQRKCAFLRTVARELDLNVKVLAARVDEVEPASAKVLSARALSDLDSLLSFADLHMAEDGIALFPKGANWLKEHEAAQKRWSYKLDAIKSLTNPEATILKIEELKRV